MQAQAQAPAPAQALPLQQARAHAHHEQAAQVAPAAAQKTAVLGVQQLQNPPYGKQEMGARSRRNRGMAISDKCGIALLADSTTNTTAARGC